MTLYFPQKVFIEEDILHCSLTKRILKKLKHIPRQVIRNCQELPRVEERAVDPIGQGKKYLLLSRQKGEFIKPCPCTPGYIGCNYFIINTTLNCPLDCSYCILQHYLSSPLITVFVNLDDLRKQLDGFLNKHKSRMLRIGTGELSDSLALDHITGLSREMIAYFRDKKNVYFELKTKTINIQNLLGVEPAENIVISWSLNTAKVAREEEKGAPSPEKRIDAARRIVDLGFPVGFHFDPLVLYLGWQTDYSQLIEKLLNTIPGGRIRWISLGSLRFHPSLKDIIKRRFPASKIISGELLPGKDGKLRYFRPLRLELFAEIAGLITSRGGKKIPVYFLYGRCGNLA